MCLAFNKHEVEDVVIFLRVVHFPSSCGSCRRALVTSAAWTLSSGDRFLYFAAVFL